jgi:AraC-like DNA-binding protein
MSKIFAQDFTDPDAYYEVMRNAANCVVTARGKYYAEYTHVDFSRLWMSHGEVSLARVSTYAPRWPRTQILFATDQNQPASHLAGMEVQTDELAVISFGSSDRGWTSAAIRWGAVSLPPEDLAALGQAISGRQLTPPSFTHRIKPSMSAFRRLRHLHKAARHLARKTPDILANPEVARALEEALGEAMVRCLASADPADVRGTNVHHAMVLRRFEDLISANPDQILYISQICAATGVSERTLLACCQEYLGMGPKRYLVLRRMHLARRALLMADPATKTVTEVATSFGFWELGRFSVVYRSLFGEMPSATLRRRPEDPRLKKIAARPGSLRKPLSHPLILATAHNKHPPRAQCEKDPDVTYIPTSANRALMSGFLSP